MDIWAWLRNEEEVLRRRGAHRLANLIFAVPQWVRANQIDRVRQTLSEAILLARQEKNPWLELYFRHWLMQGVVIRQFNVAEHMTEVIRLMEFAHREETRDCPQAICVVQDVCWAYDIRDHLGFAPDRARVAAEALARIDASWPCFTCIGSELISALRDAGQVALAQSELSRLEALAASNGQGSGAPTFAIDTFWNMVALGRFREAWQLNEAHEASEPDAWFSIAKEIRRARCLVGLDRVETASEVLPEFCRIASLVELYPTWMEVRYLLVRHGGVANATSTRRDFLQGFRRLLDLGALRYALEGAAYYAELALQAGLPYMAELASEAFASILPRLVRPLDAPSRLADLRLRIEAQKANLHFPKWVVQGDGPTSSDPEAVCDRLLHVLESSPGDVRLQTRLVSLFGELGYQAELGDWLARMVHRFPEDGHLFSLLGDHLFRSGHDDRLREACEKRVEDDVSDHHRATAHWFLANLAWRECAWERTLAHLKRIPSGHARYVESLLMRAAVYRKCGQYDAAFGCLADLEAADDRSAEWAWEGALVAAQVGNALDAKKFETFLRESGFACEERPTETVRIRGTGEQGGAFELAARRTGMVTALVCELAPPSSGLNFGDEVLVKPLRFTSDRGGHAAHDAVFGVESVPATRSVPTFPIFGVDPGNQALAELERIVVDAGGALARDEDASSETCFHPQTCEELPALYGRFAILPEAPWRAFHKRLLRATATYAHPLMWPQLAWALNLVDLVAHWHRLAVRYQLNWVESFERDSCKGGT
ncbi:hypothetical protein SCOR_34115 [Sulfidibacter corallicola]|uniref:Tetratricopeptide repeat protein n=1 Tax=Sulfidibacter corallicola TaxID=2818388 RepID=A0A8A4TIQ4_SULCO|nr:hypothetical protein [Sulfidibacter corallicola]QTD49430.1 hypothetical protein J3U87_27915 [Sulfidibacter corallicola]